MEKLNKINRIIKLVGYRFLIVMGCLFAWWFIYEDRAQHDSALIQSQNNEILAKENALNQIDMLIWEKSLDDRLLFYNKRYKDKVFTPYFGDTINMETFKGMYGYEIFGDDNNVFAQIDSTVLKLRRSLDFLEWIIEETDTTFFDVRKYPLFNIDGCIIGVGGVAKIIKR